MSCYKSSKKIYLSVLLLNYILVFLEYRTIADRVNVPIYDFVAPIETTTFFNTSKATSIVSSTEDLLLEFDSIYDAVELTHLTPPQTPPGQQYRYQQLQEEQIIYDHPEFNCSQFQSVANYFDQQNASALSEGESSIIFDSNASDVVPIATEVIPRDIAYDLEVVDEIVRSRSQDLPDWTDDDQSSFASSASLSPRSETSSFSPDYDDWKSTSIKYKSSSSGSSPPATKLKGVSKKRTRPYARGTEDKKSRKKEQNKNAATRYRQKKKQEVEVILDEERILADKNKILFSDYKDKKREVNYLKGLLREIFKAKGIIQ